MNQTMLVCVDFSNTLRIAFTVFTGKLNKEIACNNLFNDTDIVFLSVGLFSPHPIVSQFIQWNAWQSWSLITLYTKNTVEVKRKV